MKTFYEIIIKSVGDNFMRNTVRKEVILVKIPQKIKTAVVFSLAVHRSNIFQGVWGN